MRAVQKWKRTAWGGRGLRLINNVHAKGGWPLARCIEERIVAQVWTGLDRLGGSSQLCNSVNFPQRQAIKYRIIKGLLSLWCVGYIALWISRVSKHGQVSFRTDKGDFLASLHLIQGRGQPCQQHFRFLIRVTKHSLSFLTLITTLWGRQWKWASLFTIYKWGKWDLGGHVPCSRSPSRKWLVQYSNPDL